MGAKTPEQRKRAKYAAVMRDRGTPLRITEAEQEQLTTHIMKLYRRGMSCQAILDSVPGGTDIHDSALSKITRGQVATCHRDTYGVLMRAVWVQPTELKTGRRIDGTGHRRRIRGLVADGWPMSLLAELVGISTQAMFQQAVAKGPVHASTVANFLPWYEKLSCANSADYGASTMGIARAKGNASRRGWEPTLCWDDDTIDDPDAFAEWTGECGTVTGYNMHRKLGIHMSADSVLCYACRSARTEQRKAITDKRERNRAACERYLLDGKPMRWIAAELGMSTRTVQRVQRDMEARGGVGDG